MKIPRSVVSTPLYTIPMYRVAILDPIEIGKRTLPKWDQVLGSPLERLVDKVTHLDMSSIVE